MDHNFFFSITHSSLIVTKIVHFFVILDFLVMKIDQMAILKIESNLMD